jgi:hypothetical protein
MRHGETSSLHYIVLVGTVEVRNVERGGLSAITCWSFHRGDSFAATNLRLFHCDVHASTYMETKEPTECLVIDIAGHEGDFKTATKPLWYEELANYFHLSITDAADALGMCISAIKKVCRRHGISRWPHRKVLRPPPQLTEPQIESLSKGIAAIDAKLRHAGGKEAAALRVEANDLVVRRLRILINPVFLGQILPTPSLTSSRGSAQSLRQVV